MSAAVSFDKVVKAFGPVQVLHGVSFDLAPGRVVGLLGENGAGKSTLMKILAGYEGVTSGELRIDGSAVQFDGPRAAESRGIVMIHQEFALAEDLTIAQNIFLGHEKTRGWWLDDAAMRAETARVLQQVGLNASPDTLVRHLIVAEKQLVEIAKALQREARLLIMDEPTATLTPGETERLFALIAQLKADGVTMVYISHKLDEVERVTDDDGGDARRPLRRARSSPRDVTRHQMAKLMVGRELSDLYPAKDARPARRAAAEACKGSDGAGLGPRRRASRWRRARSSASPGWSARAARSCSRGLLGLRPHTCRACLEIAGHARAHCAARARPPRSRPHLPQRGSQGQGPARGFRAASENLTLMALRRYANAVAASRRPSATR